MSVKILCGLFGMSSQAYYKRKKTLLSRTQIRIAVLTAVQYYRSGDPGIGALKLYHELCSIYGSDVIGGRDAFLNLLRSEHLMLPPKKPRHTTDSKHLYKKYPNLIKDIIAQYPNHIWVSDITYIWVEGGVCYLHLLTDLYSHAVLGWILAPGLHAMYTEQALKQAILKAGSGNLCGTIHHSDRGVQYACDAYIRILMEHHIRISMTEDSKPTDNAVAERMNGILKNEWIYAMSLFKDEEDARMQIAGMIDFYNNERPHMSIGMKKPMDVYSGEVPGKCLWKKRG
ncbi:IS3 family transposase [Bacteroides sp.]|uniref:IS3 family transposase n=1 Tax=Bacteroides sp. TaxID=29523 RepID=UPI003528B1F2